MNQGNFTLNLVKNFTHKTVADVEADGLSAEQDEEEVT